MPQKTKAEIKAMTPEERIEYNKEMNRERIKKYRENHKTDETYKEKQKKSTYKYRETHPDEYKKLNDKHGKTYREKLKKEKKQAEALITISNAIKTRKAKKEMEKLKEEKKTKDLLNSIVKDALTNATTIKTIKGRPKGSKNKPVEEKYNLRSRGK